VVVGNVLGQQPFQVLFIEGNDVIQEVVVAAALSLAKMLADFEIS
jgi:hypothetical protein